MKQEIINKLTEQLISSENIPSELRERKNLYIFERIPNKSKEKIEECLENGWEIYREFKSLTRFRREKSLEKYHVDKVWSLFASLGFVILNKGDSFTVFYEKDGKLENNEFDILAIDKESIVIVKCMTSIENRTSNFKKELNNIKENISRCFKSLKYITPESKLKIKFILATKGYALSTEDSSLLEVMRGIHFDEDIIEYYIKMNDQIGLAARYQLLGSLFYDQEIPEMDNKIPAIRGKMGGHTYYSFSIEPEKLLKIAYVLHRSKANSDMMPTYQRIIQKNRLKSIHNFLDEEKGYFPNSIIISLDTGKRRELEFYLANTQVDTAVSNIGILHLPKRYRSAFIIDGQHRLYGYANSSYKETNSIPVVAFVDLDRNEQVKLFMQINENQKAVSKNLRNTLNADLLWTAESYVDQMKALRSRIAIHLGEDRGSALFNEISIGEDKKSITTQQIDIALKKSNFLGKVTKNTIENKSLFYKGDIDNTYKELSTFLNLSFSFIKENLSEEWRRDDGIIVINKGIYAIIMILSDISTYLESKGIISDSYSAKGIFEKVKDALAPIIAFYSNIDDETRNILRSSYGTGGDAKHWRTLQLELKKEFDDFNPEGLDEYLQKEEKEYNTKAFEYIREIETFFKEDFRSKLEESFGDNWLKKGVPLKIAKDANALMFEKNREVDEKDECTEWDCINIIAYREIAQKNWTLFENSYTRPHEKKISGGKDGKTKWMVKLEQLRNQNFHSYYVTEEEFYFLNKLYDWLIKKEDVYTNH